MKLFMYGTFPLVGLMVVAGCQANLDVEDPPVPAANSSPSPSAPIELPPADVPGPQKPLPKGPDHYRAKLVTTKGDIVIEVTREWSPHGADRFHELVTNGFFTDIAFFRVMEGFMAQVGMYGNPVVHAKWEDANIPDDPVAKSNLRAMVTFAKSGAPNSRSTQIFINYSSNSNLDAMGFAPFGKVVEGMDVADSLHNGYGDGPPRGRGPDQIRIRKEGNALLKRDFPKLDYIKTAEILSDDE